jgi:3,5-epimerase/4-reductase
MIAGIYMSTYSADRTKVLSLPFKETDNPNFGGSFYSYTKIRVEDILKHYPDTLILRVRMPVSDDLHPRSFVTKIKNYAKVVNVPNSHTILHDLLPMIVALAEHKETGVFNFTNPGAMSHNEVLEMYRDIVDPSYTWQNFSLEEQSKVIKADRSNCELDPGKLLEKVEQYRSEGYQVDVPEIHESYRMCFSRMNEQSRAGATRS